MRIQKNCKRLDFSTGSLKNHIIITLEELRDVEYFLERIRQALRVPPHLLGRD